MSLRLRDLWWNTIELNLAVVLNKDLLDVMMHLVCGHPSLENPDSVSQSSPIRDIETRSFGIQAEVDEFDKLRLIN